MIDEIVGQAKERQLSGRKKVIGTFGSDDPKVEKETNVKLAELANTSQNGSFKWNQFKKVVSGSPEPDTNKETNAKLAELAKNNQNGSFKGNRFKKVVLASVDANTTTGRTDKKLAELAKTRLFHHGLFFFSSPHLYTKIIKSFKGTGRIAVSKCTEILKNFFSLYNRLTIMVYLILKL